MAYPVILNGIYGDNNAPIWGNPLNALLNTPIDGFLIINNQLNTTDTFNAPVISGPNAAQWSVPGGQFPFSLNPGQSAVFLVQVTLAAANVAYSATLSVPRNLGTSPTYALTTFPGGAVFLMPTVVYSPLTKVGQTSQFNNLALINSGNSAVNINSIALSVGTNFSLLSVPFTPFGLNPGADSALFGVQFNPTVTGYQQDSVVFTTSGTEVTTTPNQIGFGSVLQSAYNLTGGTTGTLFAFPNQGQPLIKIANAANLNSEEAGSFVKLHDFQIQVNEKQLLRVRGHYEDLGPATITIMAVTRRIGEPDMVVTQAVAIGTAFADSWVREFTGDLNITGELIQLTVSRAANGGPVSIIDYIPEVVAKGEVIKGT